MSAILAISVLIRVVAVAWSLVVARRLRDRRVLLLTGMLVLMTARQLLALLAGVSAEAFMRLDVTTHLEELPGVMVSVMAFLGVLNVEDFVRRGASRGQNQAIPSTGGPPILPALAIGFTSLLAIIGVAFFAFKYSRDAIRQTVANSNLAMAQTVCEVTLGDTRHPGGERREEALKRLRQTWVRTHSPHENSYLCVVGPSGKLDLHSLNPEMQGTNVGRGVVSESSGQTVMQLLQAQGSWSGQNTSFRGIRQLVGYHYEPLIDSLVVVHIPAKIVDDGFEAAAAPWIASMALIAGLLLPGSLGLLLYSSRRPSIRTPDNAVSPPDNAVSPDESEEKFDTLLESLQDVVWSADADGRIQFINSAGERLYGRRVAELAANPAFWLEVVHPDDRDRARDSNSVLMQTGSSSLEYRIIRPDGSVRWISDRKNIVAGEAGEPVRIGGIATDITARKQAEDALWRSEANLAQAERRAGLGSWTIQPTTGETWWSDQTYRLHGIEPGTQPPSAEEHRERLVHPDDRDVLAAYEQRVFETHESSSVDFRTNPENGPVRCLSLKMTAAYDERGRFLKLVGTLLDITDRVESEQAIRHSEERYRRLVENSPFCIHEIDADGRLASMNAAGLTMMGLGDERAARGLPYLDAVCRRDKPRIATLLKQAHQGVTSDFEFESSGGKFFESCFVPLPGGDGRAQRIMGITQDATERLNAESRLRASEARFRTLVENSYDVINMFSATGELTYTSPSVKRVLGYEPEEMMRMAPGEVVHPDDFEQAGREFVSYLEQPGAVGKFVHRLRHKDGSYRTVEVTGTNLLDQPDIGAMVSIFRDITDTQEANRKLRESEARFRTIFEQAAVGVAQLNTVSGTILRVNRRYCEILRVPDGSPVGKTWMELTHPDDLATDLDRMERLRSDEIREFTLEKRLECSDGSFVWITLTVSPMWQPGEQPTTHIAIVEDITDRKAAERELQLSEERFRTLCSHAPVGIYVNDAQGNCTYVNEMCASLLGMSQDDAIGSGWSAALHPEDQQRVVGEWTQLVETGQLFSAEYRFVHDDGSVFWVQGDATSRRGDQGEVIGYIGTVMDVSDRKRHERQYRTIVETTQEWIWEINLDGVHTYSNPAIESLLGYTVDEIVGGNALLLLDEQDRSDVANKLPTLIAEKRGWTSWVLRWQHKDGDVRHLESNASPILDEHGNLVGFRGADRDVTERIRADRLLRVSEERYRAMTENATEAIVVLDVDAGRFVDFNHRACEMFKVPAARLRELGPANLSPSHQPDGSVSETVARTQILSAIGGSEPVFEWVHKDAEGQLIPCEIRLLRLPDDERRLVRGAITNITDRKVAEAERESFIAQLEQTNAELERFTYTVSHDLKSPLITIKGFLGLLEQDIQQERQENVLDDMAEISNAADRMHRLLEELLELSRIGRIANLTEEVPLRSVADDAITLLNTEITNAGTRFVFDSELPVVRGDRVRLMEVMQNLLQNAVKFSAAHDAPEVHIGTEQRDEETVIYVSDNGIGIDPRYHERVFGLFEQLTPDNNGTGIGLSIVKRIVEVHGGWIRIESDGPGHGSTVCFTLAASNAD